MINTPVFLILGGSFILGSLFFLNHYASESIAKTLSIFLSFLAILAVVYSPAITGHYIFHDDVHLLWRTGYAHRQLLLGRPLGGLVNFWANSQVSSINSTNFLRFFTIILISLIALAIDIWLNRVCGFLQKASFLASLAIVTLPPFQIYVNWVVAGNMPVAILLSIYSAMLLLKRERNKRFFLNPSFFFSLFLLLCSLMTYQAGATFFIALLAIWLIRVDCRGVNKIEWPRVHLVIYFIATLIYFFLFKILVPANALKMGIRDTYSNAVTSDYMGKLSWFFREPVLAALNLWHVFPSRAVAGGVLFIILLGVVIEFYCLMKSEENNRGVRTRNLLLKYFIILFLIILSFGVNLVARTNIFLYRTIESLITIVFILFCIGLERVIGVFLNQKKYEVCVTIVLLFVCAYGMFSAHMTFKRYCVDNNSRELSYVENEIARKYNSSIKEIYVIRPSRLPSVYVKIADEFAVTTCFYWFDIPDFIRVAAKEKGIFLPRIIISSGMSRSYLPQDQRLLRIDLNRDNESLD